MVAMSTDRDVADIKKKETLGRLRLREQDSNRIILIPTPSNDPNDPLNWPTTQRYYIAILVCMAIFFCNFLAAGPTVAIIAITETFEGHRGPGFGAKIAHVAYFFTTTALLQGMGTLFWMPFIVKFGRRPAYVSSFLLYTACAAWAGSATTYSSELASRIIMGFASGAAEVMAPLTIADIFYLHERGTIMAFYSCALSAGVGCGIIISGLITMHHHWRMIYWVSVIFIAASTILVIFTFPETQYRRNEKEPAQSYPLAPPGSKCSEAGNSTHEIIARDMEVPHPGPQRRSFVSSLRIFSGTYTDEPFYRLFVRPIVLLSLPTVFWSTLVASGTIGFLVAISSNFASAFNQAYGFRGYQSGLCFVASLIGSLIGILGGGHASDAVADFFTKRNGGIREPEMRLPAITISVITAPLALVLYGVGINNRLHWMVPTIGLGLLNFSIVQATNVTMVYCIDSYRPIAGETVVTQMAFKSAFGFLLSFYTNPWIAEAGYSGAFGAMAGISGGILILWIPFYIYGKTLRHATWKWRYVRLLAHWDDDREVGE